MVREPGNKAPRSSQPAGQLLDPFLGGGSRGLQDGLKLWRISLYSPLGHIKPRNRPALTLKAHFRGFSFIPYFLRRSNVC